MTPTPRTHPTPAELADEIHAIHSVARRLDVALAFDFLRYRDVVLDDDVDVDLARELAHAGELVRELAYTCELARHLRDLLLDLNHIRDIVEDLGFDLDRVLGSGGTIANVLAETGVEDNDFAQNLDCARDHAGYLVTAVEALQGRLSELSVASPGSAGEEVRPKVARAAARVTAAVARMLPAGERVRYGEEWAGELYDLAAAGAGRRAQLAHALRLAATGWRLRTELRTARATRRAAG